MCAHGSVQQSWVTSTAQPTSGSGRPSQPLARDPGGSPQLSPGAMTTGDKPALPFRYRDSSICSRNREIQRGGDSLLPTPPKPQSCSKHCTLLHPSGICCSFTCHLFAPVFWGLPTFFCPPSAHLQGAFAPTSSQQHPGKCPVAQGLGPGQFVSCLSQCLVHWSLAVLGNREPRPLGKGWQQSQPPAQPWVGIIVLPQGQQEGQGLGTRCSAGRGTSPTHPSGSKTTEGLHTLLPEVTDPPAQEPQDAATAPARLVTHVVAQLAPWQLSPGWCSLTSMFCCPQHLCPCTGAPGVSSSTHPMHTPRDDRGLPGVPPSTSPSPRDCTDLLNPCLRWRSSGHS